MITTPDSRLADLPNVVHLVSAASPADQVDCKVHSSIAVCPPSVRAEGPYRLTGEPTWVPSSVLLPALTTASSKRASSTTPTWSQSDAELDWASGTTWAELLADDGWTEDGRDQACGCTTYRHPSATNGRSATAHECEGYTLGDGPLHVWTSTRTGCSILDALAASGRDSISKLAAYAAIHHGSDEHPIRAAKAALGLYDAPDMSGYILGTAAPVAAAGTPSVSDGDRAVAAREALADLLANDPLTSGSRSLMAELGFGLGTRAVAAPAPAPAPAQVAPEPAPAQVAHAPEPVTEPVPASSAYRVEHHPIAGDPDAPMTVLVRDDMPSTARPETGPYAAGGPIMDVYLDYSPPPPSTLAPGGYSGWADPYTCPDGTVARHVEPLRPGRGMYLNGKYVPASKPAPRVAGTPACCAYHEPIIDLSRLRQPRWAEYTDTFFPESSMCDQMHVADALRAVGYTAEKDRLWTILRDQGATPELTEGAKALSDRLGDMTERAHRLLGQDVLRRDTQRRCLARTLAGEAHMLHNWALLAADPAAEKRYYQWRVAQRQMWVAAAHADVQTKGLAAWWAAIEPRVTRWAVESIDYLVAHPDEAPIALAPTAA